MAFNFPEFSTLRNARNLSVQGAVIITVNSSLIQCESNQSCWNHIKFWAHKNLICWHRGWRHCIPLWQTKRFFSMGVRSLC